MSSKPIRLAYLVSHPIQYQAPLLRRIAREPGIELVVFFGSDFSLRDYHDEGFGVGVKWDIPLLDGYRYEFLPALRDNRTASVFSPASHGIFSRLRGGRERKPPFDALWVHGYSTVNALHGMIAAKALGIPVLVRAESWLRDRQRSTLKLALKNAFFFLLRRLVDVALPIGTLNEAYWRRYLGGPAGDGIPLSRMPYAVDNRFFQQRSEEASSGRGALQAQLSLDPARPVILFASKLQQRKRCADLIAAYAALCAQKELPRTPYLVIVGDGEERGRLEQQAHNSGLQDNIRFCGFKNQSELPRFFDLANVFVLPSQHEPWGLIVNEVMNAARAVVVSDDVGCQPDLITDGVEGVVFPVGDVPALTHALHRVLKNPETAQQMGQRARARIAAWSFEEDVQGLRRALTLATGRAMP